MAEKLGVLVVDDSAFMRKILSEIIDGAEGFYTVATARDGQDALDKVTQFGAEIQLVTLDIEMPGMDGLTCLRKLMQDHPRRVVMVSSLTTEGARETLAALEYGAIDFIAKPGGAISLDFEQVAPQLLAILQTAARSALPRPGVPRARPRHEDVHAKPAGRPVRAKVLKGTQKLVAVTSSTGGPKALAEFLPALPGDLRAAMVLVQHMPATFTKLLATRLNQACQISVKEARDGDALMPGLCLVAPGGLHMEITRDETVRLTKDPPIGGLRPCADITFNTVASVFGSRAMGVVLTGMGHDGTAGCQALKRRGGKILAESKRTALIYGMPKSIIEKKLHDREAPIDRMAATVVETLAG